MKKTLIALTLLLAIFTKAQAQEIKFELYKSGNFYEATTAAEKEAVKLNQTGANAEEWNYGTIKKGSTGIRYFKFTNTGHAALVITNAKGSCGCLVPTYPKEPIMPGETAFIAAMYDTQRVGMFTKSLTLTTNAKSNPTVVLVVTGDVKDTESQSSVPDKGSLN